jgi:putative tryptophan/tyrosine transport system substrate-binding protein
MQAGEPRSSLRKHREGVGGSKRPLGERARPYQPARSPGSEAAVRRLEELAKVSNIGIIVIPTVLLTAARDLFIATTARLRLPTIYPYSFFAQSGGLISYGFDVRDMFRRGAGYADLILRGTKPADLPVQQPTKFELVINLRTANDLGLALPQTLVATADEVIQ